MFSASFIMLAKIYSEFFHQRNRHSFTISLYGETKRPFGCFSNLGQLGVSFVARFRNPYNFIWVQHQKTLYIPKKILLSYYKYTLLQHVFKTFIALYILSTYIHELTYMQPLPTSVVHSMKFRDSSSCSEKCWQTSLPWQWALLYFFSIVRLWVVDGNMQLKYSSNCGEIRK